MDQDKDMQGIGGWLILVAIGIIIAPVRMLFTYIPLYTQIFGDGTWEALTTVGSDSYLPFWGSLLIGEVTYNLLIILASVYLIYLFFSKHYLFPRLYIAIVVVSLIFIPLDAWLLTKVLPTETMFDPQTTKEFFRVVLGGLIWIPYMLLSKRVKATFVAHRPGYSTPSVSPNAAF